MGKVIASASMSLDGYIAKDDNTIGRLFDWYQNGEVEIPTATPDITFHLSPQSAEYWRRWVVRTGCAGLRADAVRLHRRVGRPAHHGRAGRRRHPPGPDGLGRGPSGRPVPLRHRRGRGGGGEGAGDRRGPHRRGDRRHDRPAVPGARAARRGRRRPGAGGDGEWPAVLRRRSSLEDVPLGDPTVCIQGDRVTHLVFPVGSVS